MFEIKSNGTRCGTEVSFDGKLIAGVTRVEIVMDTEDRRFVSRVDLEFDHAVVCVPNEKVNITIGEALKAAGYELVRCQDSAEG